MYFEKSDQRGETRVRGDEIKRLNKIYGAQELDDVEWVRYALGERMEGFVHFLDWNLFCIVRQDGYGSDKTLYYHIETREHYYDDSGKMRWKYTPGGPKLDIRESVPWSKEYTKENIIRFLVYKLMDHHNIPVSEIEKSSHPKKEKTVPRQQQTMDLFIEMLDEVCKAQGLERIESQSKVMDNGWVTISATLGKKERYLSYMYFNIIIGENGGIRFLSKSHAFSDVRSEWKGPEAMEQLRYMKQNPRYV